MGINNMPNWLSAVNSTLDEAEQPIAFFFRDDDGGWADRQLFELLDCFASCAIPIDLALIPQAITSCRNHLYDLVIAGNGLIGLHQHGCSHNNHQLQGRKCEFGDDRSYSQQWADIKAGKEILADYFGDLIDLIFTPPWNRCNQDTVNALLDLGFTSLSRDNTAKPLQCQTLKELPINIDWFKKHRGERLSSSELDAMIALAIAKSENPIGIMLHHEPMDSLEREMLYSLLDLLSSHPLANCRRMKDIF
jgi:hypothetical protein